MHLGELARGIGHPAAETGSAGRIDEASQSPPDENWHANRKLRMHAKLRSSVFKQTLCHCAGFGFFGKAARFFGILEPNRSGVNPIVDNQSTDCRQL